MRPDDVAHVPELLFDENESELSTNHYVVLAVSSITIFMWCTFKFTQDFFGDLGVIGLLPLVIFFGTGILSKQDFNNFSWNLIYLLGGGNVLGEAVRSSGLLTLITNNISPTLQSQSEWVVVAAFCGFVVRPEQSGAVRERHRESVTAFVLVVLTRFLCCACLCVWSLSRHMCVAPGHCDDLCVTHCGCHHHHALCGRHRHELWSSSNHHVCLGPYVLGQHGFAHDQFPQHQ